MLVFTLGAVEEMFLAGGRGDESLKQHYGIYPVSLQRRQG